jgi:DNA replication protein DnaC
LSLKQHTPLSGGAVKPLFVMNKDSDLSDKLAKKIDELSKYNAQSQRKGSNVSSMFTSKPVNVWIEEANLEAPKKMLCDVLWFENELCFLFSDTNVGKSILAVQIAQSIASNVPVKPFALEAGNQKVLYFDFELSKQQFKARYSDSFSCFTFDEKFIRLELNPDDINIGEGSSFETELVSQLESVVITEKAKVIIIDNVTYLNNHLEKANDALPLIKSLRLLKNKHNLSILLIGHTPKRDSSREIGVNDLAGSKALANFCDSMFTIGIGVEQSSLRYIKQIKARNSEIKFGSNNVVVCDLNKPTNFLGFEFVSFGHERDYLKSDSDTKKHPKHDDIIELHKEGKSYQQIVEQLALGNKAVVCRIIKRYKENQVN